MLRFLIASLLTLPAMAQAQTGPTLWSNVRYGMSVAQVRAAQPTVTVPTEPATLYGGASCDLRIARYEVANNDYSVCFFFKGGKLIQVTLNAAGEPSMSQFQDIVTALRARYGEEISYEPTSLGYNVDWLTSEKVNVNLLFFDKLKRMMNINYQVRLAADANKL